MDKCVQCGFPLESTQQNLHIQPGIYAFVLVLDSNMDVF